MEHEKFNNNFIISVTANRTTCFMQNFPEEINWIV